MVRNNIGFFFEGRKDGNGDIGIIETYKVVNNGNEKHLTLTCVLDNAGHILLPAVNNLSLGFTPINKVYTTHEELDVFVKSNRAFFGKVGEFALVGYGTVVLDNTTKECISFKNFNFYVPKTILEDPNVAVDAKGNIVPVLLCEKVSTIDELNSFKVSKLIYSAYQNSFLQDLSTIDVSSKFSYLSSLTFRGGAKA